VSGETGLVMNVFKRGDVVLTMFFCAHLIDHGEAGQIITVMASRDAGFSKSHLVCMDTLIW